VRIAWPEDIWESKLDVKVQSDKGTCCFMFNGISRDVTHAIFFIFLLFVFIYLLISF
jgi:hypothetical protein